MGNQNLGINSKKFQYFYHKSIISFQNHIKSLFITNCIILYDFLKKRSEKVPFWQKCLIFDGRFLIVLRMETKSKTCILLSHKFLINPNWYNLSPSAKKSGASSVIFLQCAPCIYSYPTLRFGMHPQGKKWADMGSYTTECEGRISERKKIR